MKTRRHEVEVLETALELQLRAVRESDDDGVRRAYREAARELGLSDEELVVAERVVAERRAAEQARRGRRQRIGFLAAGLAVVGTLVFGGLVVALQPPEPWREPVADPTRWHLVTSRDTLAMLHWPRSGSGATGALVTLMHREPDDDPWALGLEARGLPAIAGHERIRIALSGTLEHARVVLVGAPDERWVSPELDVGWEPREHELMLRSFQQQRFVDGRWRAVRGSDRDDPHGEVGLVLTLGEGVNADDPMRFVRVGEVGVE